MSDSTLENIWERHFLDSAQLYSLLPKQEKGSVVYDVGTGAGFPGMILAIMGRKDIVLCESSKKKCTFLEEVKKQTFLLRPYPALHIITNTLSARTGLVRISAY